MMHEIRLGLLSHIKENMYMLVFIKMIIVEIY